MTRLDVRYCYDEGNILDLGLFDPAVGPFPSTRGFRGWSGSSRRHIFVAQGDATPGYLAGDIRPGTWQVILGLAKVTNDCHYRIEIDFDDAERPAADISTPAPVAVPGIRWYKGDLHSHTYYSDAKGSLEDLVAAAKARGLEFLCVTDHNTSGHHLPTRQASSSELLLAPGEEVTTYKGHANVWGVDGWVDFRIERPEDLDKLIAHVHERGGLFSVNHPRYAPNCIGCDWQYPIPENIDCFEVWNGPWAYRNWEALERYDALQRQGQHVTLIGGSDRHQPGWPDDDPEFLWVGSPTTWFHLPELSERALLEGLRSGCAFVSESPAGPRLELTVDSATMGSTLKVADGQKVEVTAATKGAAGNLLRYVATAGTVREVEVSADDFTDHWQWSASGPFLRAELIAQNDEAQVRAGFEMLQRRKQIPFSLTLEEILAQPRRRALSNPIYFDYQRGE
jgi:hypothetical protein